MSEVRLRGHVSPEDTEVWEELCEFSVALERCHPDAAVHWDRDVAGSLDPSLEIDHVWLSVDPVTPAEVMLKCNPKFPGFFRYVVHHEFHGWVRVSASGEDGELRATPEFLKLLPILLPEIYR